MCSFRIVVRRTFLAAEEICSDNPAKRRSSSAPPVLEDHLALRQAGKGELFPGRQHVDQQQKNSLAKKAAGREVSGPNLKNPKHSGFQHSTEPSCKTTAKMACATSVTHSQWQTCRQRQATKVPCHGMSAVMPKSKAPTPCRQTGSARALDQQQGPPLTMVAGERARVPDRTVTLAPKVLDAADADLIGMHDEQHRTTVMIRGIPAQYHEEELKAEIRSLGFVDAFDFVFLQKGKKGTCNRGFAFVNFKRPSMAIGCFSCLSGHVWRKHQTSEVQAAAVSWAVIQGLEGNLRARRQAWATRGAGFQSRHSFKRCTKEWQLPSS
jgi:hypothetical protein